MQKERVITRELIKKADDCEAIAKDATFRLNRLIIENAQLREENEKLADRFSDDNLSIIMTLTKMGKTMDEIKEFMNL